MVFQDLHSCHRERLEWINRQRIPDHQQLTSPVILNHERRVETRGDDFFLGRTELQIQKSQKNHMDTVDFEMLQKTVVQI